MIYFLKRKTELMRNKSEYKSFRGGSTITSITDVIFYLNCMRASLCCGMLLRAFLLSGNAHV